MTIGLRDLHVDDLQDPLLNRHSGQQLSVRRALRVTDVGVVVGAGLEGNNVDLGRPLTGTQPSLEPPLVT